uniref:Uncharacterized protein n=1 Tax=Mus musculus TaxID=10090 RepID=Q9DAF6_MOUSE|nr:unnamed protein product [Mus musculus]
MPGQLKPSLQQSLAQYPNHKEIAATVIGHVQGKSDETLPTPSFLHLQSLCHLCLQNVPCCSKRKVFFHWSLQPSRMKNSKNQVTGNPRATGQCRVLSLENG